MYSMWGPDTPVVPPDQALRQFTCVALGFISFGFFCKAIAPDRPAIPREYPFSGLDAELGGVKVRGTYCFVAEQQDITRDALGASRERGGRGVERICLFRDRNGTHCHEIRGYSERRGQREYYWVLNYTTRTRSPSSIFTIAAVVLQLCRKVRWTRRV